MDKNRNSKEAIKLFEQMEKEKIQPNNITFVSILKLAVILVL